MNKQYKRQVHTLLQTKESENIELALALAHSVGLELGALNLNHYPTTEIPSYLPALTNLEGLYLSKSSFHIEDLSFLREFIALKELRLDVIRSLNGFFF